MYVTHPDQHEMSTSYLPSIVQFSYPSGGYSSLICPFDGVQLDLSRLARLEVVTVYTAAYLIEKTRNSSLPTITKVVRTAGPSLRCLVLNIEFSFGGAPAGSLMEWKPLILLCDSLPQIQVDLCIGAASHNGLSFVEVVDSLVGNKDLSGLVERGSVLIKPLVPPDL